MRNKLSIISTRGFEESPFDLVFSLMVPYLPLSQISAIGSPWLKALISCDIPSSSWMSKACNNYHTCILAIEQWTNAHTYTQMQMWLTGWCYSFRYPIYIISMGPTFKDVDACFLTFYSLDTPLSGNSNLSVGFYSWFNHLA